MANDTVTVRLRGSFRYQGQMYGPGEAVEVPAAMARALSLQAVEPATDTRAPKAAKASTAKPAASKASAAKRTKAAS